MVQVLSKDLLEITWFDQDSLIAIKHTKGIEALLVRTVALVPAHIDDLFEEIVLEARSLVVVTVNFSKLNFLFTLRDAIETEIVKGLGDWGWGA